MCVLIKFTDLSSDANIEMYIEQFLSSMIHRDAVK